jgi:hypothetical protein
MLKFSAEDGRQLYKDFDRVYEALIKGLKLVDTEPSHNSKMVSKRILIPFINAGIKLAKYVLHNKSIPARSKKDMEMATRIFMKVKRAPSKPKAWIKKNKRRIDFLRSTIDLPEKSLGSDEMFKVGPFTVHNTVGAEGKELEFIKDLIRKSHKSISSSSVPSAKSLLYGDVLLTGQLLQAHANAWYNVENDNISLRIRKKVDADAVQALIHEFGHRLWNRKLDKEIKRQWGRYHRSIGSSNMPLPDVGDPLGFPIQGNDEPLITKIEGDKFFLEGGGYLSARKILDAYTQYFSYPTRYSSVNEEEHFCEAFSMYCLGVLPSEHEEVFEKYIIRGEEFSYAQSE